MRAFLVLSLLATIGCGTDADDADDTDDTTGGGDTDDTTGGGDTDDTTGGDTDDTTVEDTDEVATFSPVGTWSLTNGRVTAVGGTTPPCPALGQQASAPTQTLTWGEGASFSVELSSFTIDYTCSLSGSVATCTPSEGSTTNGSGYFIGYQWPLTITLGDDGSATVVQTANATCMPVGPSGSCQGVPYCVSSTVTWEATKP